MWQSQATAVAINDVNDFALRDEVCSLWGANWNFMYNLDGLYNRASLRRPGFAPGPVHVGYAVDKHELPRFSSSQASLCLRAFVSGVHKYRALGLPGDYILFGEA